MLQAHQYGECCMVRNGFKRQAAFSVFPQTCDKAQHNWQQIQSSEDSHRLYLGQLTTPKRQVFKFQVTRAWRTRETTHSRR